MDAGAHFHRCDLQVHTPRDSQWAGRHHQSDDDRREYAATFIHQCRGKGLDAVAITDHHDLTFFKYIKEAARNELDDEGNSVPENRQTHGGKGPGETACRIPASGQRIQRADPSEWVPARTSPSLSSHEVCTVARGAFAVTAEVPAG